MKSLWNHLSAAVLASAAVLPVYAGDTYQVPSVDLAKVCADTHNRSGALLNGKDMCEISTDGGKTWIVWTGLWLAWVAAGWFLVRLKRKKNSERVAMEQEESEKEALEEKTRSLADVEKLRESNPPFHAAYREASEYISTEFSGIDQDVSYSVWWERISIDFKHKEEKIQVWVLPNLEYVVFKGADGYQNNGTWPEKSNNVSMTQLKNILS